MTTPIKILTGSLSFLLVSLGWFGDCFREYQNMSGDQMRSMHMQLFVAYVAFKFVMYLSRSITQKSTSRKTLVPNLHTEIEPNGVAKRLAGLDASLQELREDTNNELDVITDEIKDLGKKLDIILELLDQESANPGYRLDILYPHLYNALETMTNTQIDTRTPKMDWCDGYKPKNKYDHIKAHLNTLARKSEEKGGVYDIIKLSDYPVSVTDSINKNADIVAKEFREFCNS